MTLFSMLQAGSPGAKLSLNEQVAAGTNSAEELLGQGLHRASVSLPHYVMVIAAPAAPLLLLLLYLLLFLLSLLPQLL